MMKYLQVYISAEDKEQADKILNSPLKWIDESIS